MIKVGTEGLMANNETKHYCYFGFRYSGEKTMAGHVMCGVVVAV